MKKIIVIIITVLLINSIVSCNNMINDTGNDDLEKGKFDHSKYSRAKFVK